MDFDPELEQKVQAVILDVIEVLNRHGIETVSIGAIMRILGVPADLAKEYDNDIVKATVLAADIDPPPVGTIYH